MRSHLLWTEISKLIRQANANWGQTAQHSVYLTDGYRLRFQAVFSIKPSPQSALSRPAHPRVTLTVSPLVEG